MPDKEVVAEMSAIYIAIAGIMPLIAYFGAGSVLVSRPARCGVVLAGFQKGISLVRNGRRSLHGGLHIRSHER
jgi:hypothetical protein